MKYSRLDLQLFNSLLSFPYFSHINKQKFSHEILRQIKLLNFKQSKNIDRITLMGLLEQAFRALLIKQYGSDENFDIVVNANKGDLQIFHNKIENLFDVASTVLSKQFLSEKWPWHKKLDSDEK